MYIYIYEGKWQGMEEMEGRRGGGRRIKGKRNTNVHTCV
jgi:hypothetical protein